jgi:flap endonuclease-1
VEIDFAAMLAGMQLTYEEFVHLCILCGCDYCSTIKGIGPKTALKLIRAHKTIEQYFNNVYLYSPIVVIVLYALGLARASC